MIFHRTETHWIKGAVKRPGREKRRAAEHGISVHEQLERDSHSSDPSLRGAGKLGLRFTSGDLHKSKSREERAAQRYRKKG